MASSGNVIAWRPHARQGYKADVRRGLLTHETRLSYFKHRRELDIQQRKENESARRRALWDLSSTNTSDLNIESAEAERTDPGTYHIVTLIYPALKLIYPHLEQGLDNVATNLVPSSLNPHVTLQIIISTASRGRKNKAI